MAEEIKVILEADARQMTGEFKKARAEAEAFSKKTLPLLSGELNRSFVGANKAAAGMKGLERSAKGAGNGMLQAAFFADDLQYGLKGVLNNIPGLVMGFGAGAGLAGAISLAALAAAKLGPLLKELYGDEDIAKINAVADATANRFAAELEGLNKLKEEAAIREKIAKITAGMSRYAADELRIQDQRLEMIDNQRQQMELQRRLADELATAQAAVDVARGRLDGPGTGAAAGKSASDAAAAVKIERLQEDLDLARKEAKLASEEYDRISTANSNIQASAGPQLAAAKAEIERLQRSVIAGRGNVSGFEEGVKTGLQGSKANLGAAQRRLDDDEKKLATAKELAAELTRQLAESAAETDKQLAGLSARIDGAEREKRVLEETIPAMKEINRLAAERAELDDALAAAAKQREELSKPFQLLQGLLAEQGAKMDWQVAIGEELKVAALRSQGLHDEADALEKANMLRKEATRIAAETGQAEADVLKVLQQKNELQEKGKNAPRPAGGAPTSRIPQAGSPESKIRQAAAWKISAGRHGIDGRRPDVPINAGSWGLNGRRESVRIGAAWRIGSGLSATAAKLEAGRNTPPPPSREEVSILNQISESNQAIAKALEGAGLW